MALESTCIFCRIVAGEAEASLVFHDDLVTAFMDAHPVATGHLLVVPNHHAADLAALDDPSSARMFQAARRLAAALRRSGLPCEGINLVVADGRAAGQSVFHTHLHVIPRHAGDGFGFRRPLGVGRMPSRQEMDSVAQQVRAGLNG